MASYIEYELEDGVSILVEEIETNQITKASKGEEIIKKKAKKNFKEAFREAKMQAMVLIKEIDDLPISEAEVKFGLKTAGEVGNLAIGKVGIDINYEITLKWKKKE